MSTAKQQSWQSFVEWCGQRGLCPAPANPWTLAAYVRSLEGDMRPDAIDRRVAQIGQVHFEKLRKRPDRDPLVARTLESVRDGERQRAEVSVIPPLFRAEDFTEEKPAKPARRPRTKDAEPASSRRTLSAAPKLVRRKRV